ncbi:peptidoglycan/LPS O-acetylase OafA/YrhL [Rhizomicrobium palustre]|uniref:Peptidoglycan/LPS O-acetylase OafA/YrhL n=1 Tax=Rhizomicrobium palustre TaxID=189966 RepID=A0A846MUP3_9PROT|nr:acyltransferase family protein [Rhizomicrobium palustre]NIK86949.1 peptidoglycan/LPS O-acetylase OafA/YrhL [Rhizomicrobium palustre]
MRSSSHRHDIDALRAIAVLLVIAYHFGLSQLSGGFVGVDIFFVISGFLIGGILDRELAEGRFSLTRFYERRVRRIFPALFAVLGASAVAASLWLFPADFQRFAESVGAAALFWSNIFFNATAGYWDVAASSKPLLHTWSLAVEEQFYLVFPLVLFAIRKWSLSRRAAVLGVLGVASFVASVWAVKADPTGAFYLAPYRFWEFLIGAGLAIAPDVFARLKGWSDAAALAGLVMIVVAALTLTPGANFPGLGAVLPCLGAALLIAAGPENSVSRALSWRPIAFIGLISYSLYLWHWPIWVFANHLLARAPTPLETAGLVALTLAASVLSWRFIEQPFRAKDAVSRKPLFAMAAAAMALLCIFAGVGITTNGLPGRFDSKIVAIAAQQAPRDAVRDHCFGIKPEDVSVHRLCGIGEERQPASFVLWGDSHAEAIEPAIADIAKRHNRRGLFAGSPSCVPLVGVDRYDVPACRAFNDRVLAMILRHKEITTVILMARWGKAAQGTAYGNEGNGFVAIGDDEAHAQAPAENAPIFARGLKRTVDALRAGGKQVLLVGPVPEIGWTVPQVLARLAQEHREHVVVSPPAKKFYEREAEVLPLFHAMAEQQGVSAVFPHDYLCKSGRCAVRKEGIPLYKDEHHLSDYGAKKLEPLLDKAIDPLFKLS